MIAPKADHLARALVKLRQARGQIRGIALLAGHFLQPPRHFAKRLCPTGSGVRNHGNRMPLVTVVLRNRDAGINGSLPRRHRHIGGVGNQHRALHQRLSGARVGQFRELPQHVGHLVAALAAADIDHQIYVAPLGKLVLYYGLSGAERPRHARGAALGNGKERVNHALTRNQRLIRGQFFRIRARDTHRPLLHQRQRQVLIVGKQQGADLLGHRKVALAQLRDHASRFRGHHNLV